MKLTICHLYPDLMNTYGDRGNMITLYRRALWRGIEVEVVPVSIGENLDFRAFDLIFFGGGQDKEQRLVCQDLVALKKGSLIDAIEDGVVVLAVCGGYQLLGEYYRTLGGEELPGVGALDIRTEAGSKRFIGNVVIESQLPLEGVPTLWGTPTMMGAPTIVGTPIMVGFENHSGRTYLGDKTRPLGRVIVGHGNNGGDGSEGCIYKNTYGTYLHGPLLPKNPHFADYLIQTALSREYNGVRLQPLDDGMELRAHRAAVARARRH
ncbi:MAG: glutamine amidotransferase [Firmicutes bacterium]|nr:glutamine amidotransferase [Bacillota bacterium]